MLIGLFFFQLCISQWVRKGRKDSLYRKFPLPRVPHGSVPCA